MSSEPYYSLCQSQIQKNLYLIGQFCLNRTGELCNLREGARVAGTHCLRRRSLLQVTHPVGQ